jgi:hypothetical protein
MIEPAMRMEPADTSKAVTEKYTQAFNLNARIRISAQMAQQNLYEVCKGLKEMRDGKLYKELGYKNFEDYAENEVGISRFMAYKYIAVADMKNVESIQQIGITKLSLLATISDEQREEVQQTVDLESTSVRELKEKIKSLESAKETAETELGESKRRTQNLLKKNIELVEQVKELESCPIDVAVSESDSKELELLKNQLLKANEQHRNEIDRIRSEYEQQLAQKPMQQEILPSITGSKEIFRAYLANAVDALNRLTEYMDKNSRDSNMSFFIQRLEQVVNITQEKLNGWKGE